MKRTMFGVAFASMVAWSTPSLLGFCGFYVAKADTKLFNHASQVVLVRDGDRTVMTMANDFKGEPKEFAVVIPVPTFLKREQIHVGEKALVDHLDAYSAPRLVEYFDENPCRGDDAAGTQQGGCRIRSGAADGGRRRGEAGSASPSKLSTPSASTTSSSSPRSRARGWTRGSARTAIEFQPAHPRFYRAT